MAAINTCYTKKMEILKQYSNTGRNLIYSNHHVIKNNRLLPWKITFKRTKENYYLQYRKHTNMHRLYGYKTWKIIIAK